MPGPGMEQAVGATLVASHYASPIEVHFYDENEHQDGHLAIRRDGTTDDATAARGQAPVPLPPDQSRAPIATQTLAMLADLAEKYEQDDRVRVACIASGGRVVGRRRIAMRVRSTSASAAWRSRDPRLPVAQVHARSASAGIPSEQFIHMDTRPDDARHARGRSYSGVNHYHPYWAEVARQPVPKPVKHAPITALACDHRTVRAVDHRRGASGHAALRAAGLARRAFARRPRSCCGSRIST